MWLKGRKGYLVVELDWFAECRGSLGLCWHSQMHNMIQKLVVRWWYQSLFSCCCWVLNINHKLCVLRLILCSHSDLRVNVLFFHLYLRTDESVLGLASLSTQTKSIFHTHPVLAISCFPSEVTSALEVSTPSILFVFFFLQVFNQLKWNQKFV